MNNINGENIIGMCKHLYSLSQALNCRDDEDNYIALRLYITHYLDLCNQYVNQANEKFNTHMDNKYNPPDEDDR